MAAGATTSSLGRLDWAVVVSTCFGVGLVPVAPGTFGSIAALPLAWAMWRAGGGLGVLAGAALLFGLGWAAAARMVRATGARDPQNIVIDEVVGQLLTLAVAPFGFGLWAAGLVLFRAADILKPFPAGWADRHLGGGLGIMLDDVFAALWSAPLLWGLTLLLGR